VTPAHTVRSERSVRSELGLAPAPRRFALKVARRWVPNLGNWVVPNPGNRLVLNRGNYEELPDRRG
jgi:hypothetical protein